jgi:hypothetical protein
VPSAGGGRQQVWQQQQCGDTGWLALRVGRGASSWVLDVLSECCTVRPGMPAPPDWLQGWRGGAVLAPRLCAHAAAGCEQQWQHQHLGKGEDQAGVLWG